MIWLLANGFDRCYNYISIMRFGLPDMFEITGRGLILMRDVFGDKVRTYYKGS